MLWLLAIVACAPAEAPGVALPEFLAVATAHIAPSYPTAGALISSPDQSSSGIQIRMDRAWRDGKNLNADVCFTLPDASDWSISSAALNSGELVQPDFGTMLINLQEPINGQPGERCDTLTFLVPPDAEIGHATITIEAIAAYPREDEYCTVYMPKIQQALVERGVAITVGCTEDKGVATLQILSRPPEMSMEQAQDIVFDDDFYSVHGPWAFAFSVSQ